jgi:CRP/FNR family transcriptional regulator, dissimilatory nitrate respiration regulator
MTNLLKQNFWDSIPEKCKPALMQNSFVKKYSKGSIVFHEQDIFTGFYVVKKGKFKIYNLNREGKEAILRILQTGEVIAIPMTLVDNSTYPATLECMEDGELHYFEQRTFRRLLTTFPELESCIAKMVSQYILLIKNKTSSLMLLNLKERILNYIKEEGGETKFISLPIPKNQLALLLDATPESISRAFKALELEGSIEVNDDKYKLS